MLDLQRLREQLNDFNTYQSDEQRRQAERLRLALDALEECDPHWEALRQHAAERSPDWLVATLREAPATSYTGSDRPTPMTVVATDGSQIFPDRHVEPTCFLLNISRIAFQYGTMEPPIMEAEPRFHYRRDELDELFDEVIEAATTEVVSAIRDELELRDLLAIGKRARQADRPILALADGTLIRWMIRGMNNRRVEEELIERYTALLAQFREEQIPLCSYVSMPRNTEVINLLRVHRGECDDPPPPESLAGLNDRRLFERTLRPGERSAVFESASHIQDAYGIDRICYFYIHVPTRGGGSEIGRVEVPAWVAADAALLETIHAAILSECEKGDGYPIILAEAHERAVIRAQEKEVFYHLIECEMHAAGLRFRASRKRSSKRRPMV